MKKLLLSAILIGSFITVQADNIMYSLAANTSSNLFAIPGIVDSITVTASTTNNTTLRFYDSRTTTTTYVQAAYTRYSTYSTNYSVTFTNEANVLITNSFSGVYTGPTSVSASTSSLPSLLSIIIPASSQRTKNYTLQVMRGLTVVPDQNCVIEVDYRKNP